MFGTVSRDTFGNNMTMKDNLIVDASVYVSYRTPVRRTIVVPQLDNSSQEVEYTLVIDSSESKIGDIVIVFFSLASDQNNALINFPENLYFINCGERVLQKNIGTYERFAMLFQFDGEVFIQGYENY